MHPGVATSTEAGRSLQLGSLPNPQFSNPLLSSQPLLQGQSNQGLVLAPIVPPYAPILMPQAAAGTYLPFSSNTIAPFKNALLAFSKRRRIPHQVSSLFAHAH
jgi:hypothetical protein